MKNVFISWSGDRSEAVAEALREWLPTVIQAIDPWVSVADIDKGARWHSEVATRLQEAKIGIICLTSENLNAPWLLFEAGALPKTLDRTFVCPFLLDIQPSDLEGPLTQFQATVLENGDTRKMMSTMNRAMGEKALEEQMLDKQFEKWWPDLEGKLKTIPKQANQRSPKRVERDMIEEILDMVRSQAREQSDFRKILGEFVGALVPSWPPRTVSTPPHWQRLYASRESLEALEKKAVALDARITVISREKELSET